LIQGRDLGTAVGAILAMLALLALVQLIKILLYIVMVAVFALVICSWFSLSGPMIPVLDSMTRPFLRPFRRRIPPIGNVDLSPLILLVVIQLLLMVPIAFAEAAVMRLL